MGSIAWFARNSVAANLLMALIVVGAAVSVSLRDAFPLVPLLVLAVVIAATRFSAHLVSCEIARHTTMDLVRMFCGTP